MKIHKHGFAGYASIVQGLKVPSTTRQVAKRHNLGECNARAVTRELYELGLLHIAGWRRTSPVGIWDRLYKTGDGPDAPPPLLTTGKPSIVRVIGKPQPRPALIAFAHIWRALESPSTVRQLVDDTGVGEQAIGRLLRHAREIRAVRVSGWERSGSLPVPVYCLGGADDVPRPPREPSYLVSRRTRAKAKADALAMRLGHMSALEQPWKLAA